MSWWDGQVEGQPAPDGGSSWWDKVRPDVGEPGDSNPQYFDFGGRALKWLDQDPGAEAEKQRKAALYGQAGAAGGFADAAQQGYANYGAQGQTALDALRRQATGQDSVSAEQLRQSLAQNLAQQRSLAAGASPRNSAMAARPASIQSGRLGSGMAGQQAIAGMQERQQANSQYGQLLQGLRGQDLNASLGSRQNAITGYGAQNAGEREKSNMEKYGGAITGGLGAMLMSDRRTKKNIRGGDHKANKATERLRAYTYAYKNAKHGKGEQLGTTTQDLKRAGLGQAVVKTPEGEAVHGGKLAGANTAMIAALGRRVAELEGRKGR
jgi:hypothetical protein